MQTLVSYVRETLHSFSQIPFGEADSLVLSQLSYLHFDGLVPPPSRPEESVRLRDLFCAEWFSALSENVRDPVQNIELLTALSASPRFRNLRLSRYTNEIDPQDEKQFSAVTMQLDADTVYVAFRGTDATLVGWKEDLNMAFLSPIPSQKSAMLYLDTLPFPYPKTVLVGGHSKGGNLSVFAAAYANRTLQQHIKTIYSHDGPGFLTGMLESPFFRAIAPKLQKSVPEYAVVGLLLEHHENYKIVQSNRSRIMQHDPFSWLIQNGAFVESNRKAAEALRMNAALHRWLAATSPQDRAIFIDTLYELISSKDATTVDDLSDGWQRELTMVLSAAKQLSPAVKKQLFSMISELALFPVKERLKPLDEWLGSLWGDAEEELPKLEK